MNRYLSEVCDLWALSQMHRTKSKFNQFVQVNSTPLTPKHSNMFYIEPQLPRIEINVDAENNNYQIGKLIFESQVKTNYPENNIVSSSFYCTRKSKSNITIIIVHGWRMNSIHRLEKMFLKDFLAMQYNIYFPVLPYHLERKPNGSFNGEYLISANIERTLLAIKQAVSDYGH